MNTINGYMIYVINSLSLQRKSLSSSIFTEVYRYCFHLFTHVLGKTLISYYVSFCEKYSNHLPSFIAYLLINTYEQSTKVNCSTYSKFRFQPTSLLLLRLPFRKFWLRSLVYSSLFCTNLMIHVVSLMQKQTYMFISQEISLHSTFLRRYLQL